MPQDQSASDLEVQIHALVGRYPGFARGTFGATPANSLRNLISNRVPSGDDHDHRVQLDYESTITLLRQWLIAKEVDETKVWRCTHETLETAYRSGDNYITAIKNNNYARKNPPRNPRRGTFVNLDDSDFFDTNTKDLLSETPQAPTQPTQPQAPAQISARDIERAVETLTTPKVNSIRRDITNTIDTELRNFKNNATLIAKSAAEDAIKSAGLGDKLTQEIITLATDAATKFVESITPTRIEIKTPTGEIRDLGTDIRHQSFEEIFRWLISGSHVYIVGPKGTGKTHMGTQLRDALRAAFSRPDYDVFFIDQSLTKYDVKGFVSPVGDYIETQVYKCVKVGGLLFIDEGDMWAAAALGALNSILANQLGAFPNGTIEVHKDFRCVLAANTYGQGTTREYVGRNPLDAASLDRFSFVNVDYDRDMELKLYGKSAWLEYIWRVRDACKQLKKENLVPSMRAISTGLAGLSAGLTIDQVCNARLWKGSDETEINMIKNLAGAPPAQVGSPDKKLNGDLKIDFGDIDPLAYARVGDRIKYLTDNNQKINAIKELRNFKNNSLSEAMKLIDAFTRGEIDIHAVLSA